MSQHEPPKTQQKPAKTKKPENPIVKLLTSVYKDYEQICREFNCSMCPNIKETFQNSIANEELAKVDRRKVEYLEDGQFSKWLEKRIEREKKKKAERRAKSEKPLVRLLPLIEAIRNNRYLPFQKLYGDMLAKGNYQLAYIELTDCYLSPAALSAFAPFVNYTKTLRELILDFNEFGDAGCRILCEGLKPCTWLVRLSLCFCGLNMHSGLMLGELIAVTSIRELYLNGNNLGADGVSDLISKLADAALMEGQERERLKAEKLAAAEAPETRERIDLDAPPPPTTEKNTTEQKEEPKAQTNTEKPKNVVKKGKKKQSQCGPFVTHLHLAENNINNLGRGGSLGPARCMQLLKTIIAFSKELKEVDLFGNDIGNVAGRIILEGILARKDNKLPRIGVKVSHLINQDTFDMIGKLAPRPKGKKK